ncbi:hypothetical protein Y1Q_0008853 [Alligator mississippiensis]|uniref:Uncharacterized protein n=1 Tax=Alligator mississippiensis TaxID=8496 RepID=A0A151NAG1_ALLMI|nr:hypothetical protein Y1Q_0008853 [Alligator mississippiensis]
MVGVYGVWDRSCLNLHFGPISKLLGLLRLPPLFFLTLQNKLDPYVKPESNSRYLELKSQNDLVIEPCQLQSGGF